MLSRHAGWAAPGPPCASVSPSAEEAMEQDDL